MIKDEKISSIQIILMHTGFLIGSTAIFNPSAGAHQDAWLANIIGMTGGLILATIYMMIALLNPDKTLVEILRDNFGKYLGNFIAVFYIWYFFHLGALVVRDFGEFTVTTIYPETPLLVIVFSFVLVCAFAVKKGLEVLARVSELFVPIILVVVIFSFFMLISIYDPMNFFPFLERGLKPVLKASLTVLTFPYGETVTFLMVFPFLNSNRKNYFKISFLSIIIVGLLIQIITVRDLMSLGPDMFVRDIFPSNVSAKLIPNISISPLIGANLLIGGGTKIAVCLFATALGITQLFNLNDYKPLVIPLALITITTTIWLYGSVFELISWDLDIWPYYSIPFQIILPILLLIVSLIKKKLKFNSQ